MADRRVELPARGGFGLLAVAAILYLITLGIVMSALRAIFGAVLYLYAKTGTAPEGFDAVAAAQRDTPASARAVTILRALPIEAFHGRRDLRRARVTLSPTHAVRPAALAVARRESVALVQRPALECPLPPAVVARDDAEVPADFAFLCRDEYGGHRSAHAVQLLLPGASCRIAVQRTPSPVVRTLLRYVKVTGCVAAGDELRRERIAARHVSERASQQAAELAREVDRHARMDRALLSKNRCVPRRAKTPSCQMFG